MRCHGYLDNIVQSFVIFGAEQVTIQPLVRISKRGTDMEEQRDQSEDDIVSLSPSLPSPPLLPLQAAHHTHRTTNFFIDNILRSDFGCKREHRPTVPSTPCPDSTCSTDSVSSSASSTVSSPASSRHSKADEADRGNTAKPGVVSASSVALNSPGETSSPSKDTQPFMWPAWVYCTRFSDRPSSGKASDNK